MLEDLIPDEIMSNSKDFEEEINSLKAIRPHALIATNYDRMLESLFTGYEAIVGKQVLRYNLNAYG